MTLPSAAAACTQTTPQRLTLAGTWTALGLHDLPVQLDSMQVPAGTAAVADLSALTGLDTAGAWLLQSLLLRLRAGGAEITMQGQQPAHTRLLDAVAQQMAVLAAQAPLPAAAHPTLLQHVGTGTVAAGSQAWDLLSFVGESSLVLAGMLRHPARIRWRPILYNIQVSGFNALPIVGLLAFLLGVVVAYQGADQLRRYGANIFVADLVGVSMLREFAPLITAIIVAGRSGSAYAAQIGTMAVTEEIDAMRTIGIVPIELLVLPKLLALVIALPLLTVFADLMGVLGGMLMARAVLDVGYVEFIDRLAKAVSLTTGAVGLGKAPVFAAIIVVIGCFQGFRTQGGADSVGRQTTRSVVQSIFLVIVADALFSVAFSALDL
jgi:phospholipid/cholesterol/gamma-HCH transport system permease protein